MRIRVLGVLCLLAVAPIRAQESASISGRITDPSGAVVPRVAVKAEEINTSFSRSTISDAGGLYTFANMPVGTYTITAEAPGFKKTVVPDIRAEVAQAVRIDLTLEIGAISDRVEVSAELAALQTSDSQVGGVVTTKAISDLPLNGRNFTQLMVLMAGAVERSGGTVAGQYGARPSGTAFSVNGQKSTSNQFLIDGFMAKEVQHGTNSIEPIIDALREFRVQTSNYTAEFGTEAGGQINAVLKSGTNELHGTLWEFLRNDKLDANNFFNNRAGVDRAPFRRNQFGVAAGGPVILPKLYDGRNRTFIFGAYEGTRVRKGITQLTTVPTAALRSGDFSGVGAVRDPLTGQPFANNRIPAERVSPIARTILERWVPLPNSADPTFNWISNDPQKIGVEQYNWRIDHRISNSDSVFGHYLFEDTDFRYPKLFPSDGASQKLRGQNALTGWTHLFGSRTLNEFRAGFSRYVQNEFQARAGVENVVGELGMQGLCEVSSCWGIPQMSVTGFAPFGEHGGQSVSGPRGWRNEVYQWQDSVYHTIGPHNLRFGATIKRHRDNFPEAIYPRGTYSYTGFLTGQAFGDYLLGLPRTTQTSIDLFSPHFRYTVVEPWFQNDWRVNRELTLNFGLRWEWAGRPVSKDGTISSIIFDRSGARQITGKDPQGYPVSLAYNDYNNFAPRVGFAYNPRWASRTVFRSAYGIFYQRELANTWVDLAINTPFIRQTLITLDNDPASRFYFGRYNLAAPTALAPPQPLLVFSVDPNWRDGMVHQWNFNVQQELGFSTVAQIGYVGNRGMRLARATLPNQPRPGPGPVDARRPYPNFGQVWGFDSGGDTNYHSLQIQVEKRFSHGLQFINAYTWSKCIDNSAGTFVGEPGGTSIQDNYNFRGQRGLCAQDTRHRYSLSWVYDLPFGRGRAMGGNLPRVAEAVLGGWQINGILTLRTGDPFSVGVSGDPANVGDGSTRADLIGKGNDVPGGQTIDRWFNTAAFARPDNFRFGTSGRNIVIGPGTNNVDFSLFKILRLDEARQFQVRGEFFNLFNHPQFALPGATFGTAQFGRISATQHDPRDVQLSLKFLF